MTLGVGRLELVVGIVMAVAAEGCNSEPLEGVLIAVHDFDIHSWAGFDWQSSLVALDTELLVWHDGNWGFGTASDFGTGYSQAGRGYLLEAGNCNPELAAEGNSLGFYTFKHTH
jgi:hypothetical protein